MLVDKGGATSLSSSSSSSPRFTCSECSKTYSSKQALSRHKKSHKENSNTRKHTFKCNVCDKILRDRNDWTRHKKTKKHNVKFREKMPEHVDGQIIREDSTEKALEKVAIFKEIVPKKEKNLNPSPAEGHRAAQVDSNDEGVDDKEQRNHQGGTVENGGNEDQGEFKEIEQYIDKGTEPNENVDEEEGNGDTDGNPHNNHEDNNNDGQETSTEGKGNDKEEGDEEKKATNRAEDAGAIQMLECLEETGHATEWLQKNIEKSGEDNKINQETMEKIMKRLDAMEETINQLKKQLRSERKMAVVGGSLVLQRKRTKKRKHKSPSSVETSKKMKQ